MSITQLLFPSSSSTSSTFLYFNFILQENTNNNDPPSSLLIHPSPPPSSYSQNVHSHIILVTSASLSTERHRLTLGIQEHWKVSTENRKINQLNLILIAGSCTWLWYLVLVPGDSGMWFWYVVLISR